jgi:hypothetical protein
MCQLSNDKKYYVRNKTKLKKYLFLFPVSRMKKLGWNKTIAIVELSSHNSEDIILSYTWKTKFEYNFFKSYFTLTDYGACSIVYPYLDFENPSTRNLTSRQYDGVTLYDKVFITMGFLH